MSTISDIHFEKTEIDNLTREGTLYRPLNDKGTLECFSCGHRCTIKVGRRGICKVRYNEDGVLRVPWGYVGALQCDPTEKKPFFHIYPGSDTLTFGMLGCDFHCPYCFTGDTLVVTDRGPMTLAELFNSARRIDQKADGEIAYPDGVQAVAASGTLRAVRKVFKHPYRGQLAIIHPFYLPALRCTIDHRIYATDDVSHDPQPIQAQHLTEQHYLAIPRQYAFSSSQVLDIASALRDQQVTYRIAWGLSEADRQGIIDATARGETSRQIGAQLGKDPSYIRHVRSKVARGRVQETRTSGPIIEDGFIRFPNEHRPGLPLTIPLDTQLAKLLGYYCAEGSVVQGKNRPNSYTLNFSFSHNEARRTDEVCQLLRDCFGVEAGIVLRETTRAVACSKSSVALLFKTLAGSKANNKHVPQIIFDAHSPIVEAFMQAYAGADGHRYPNGKVSATTVSTQLAYGVAWLALKLGCLPSVYKTDMPAERTIQGRTVKLSPYQYTVVWYEDADITRQVIETEKFYLVPVRGVEFVEYEGDVYNMEVEEEHNYLAGFFLVSNCQNWETSQVLRDPHAEGGPTIISAEQLIALAKRHGARLVGSSYNEPLITSEWAVDVFKVANREGFKCVYISNGNLTPEVLAYIRPHLVGYKIDLKSMRDKPYRQLGGVLQNVLDGIKAVHDAGLWLEIVTLVIPGFNDSDEELRDAANYLASISSDIPWHVTAFHQDYKMTEPDNTDAKVLLRAAAIGRTAGLKFVYAGNLPGQVGPHEHTWCPQCNALLIGRFGYVILEYNLSDDGHCPHCGEAVPGVWSKRSEVQLGGLNDLFRRVPRPVRRFRSDVYEN